MKKGENERLQGHFQPYLAQQMLRLTTLMSTAPQKVQAKPQQCRAPGASPSCISAWKEWPSLRGKVHTKASTSGKFHPAYWRGEGSPDLSALRLLLRRQMEREGSLTFRNSQVRKPVLQEKMEKSWDYLTTQDPARPAWGSFQVSPVPTGLLPAGCTTLDGT